MTSWAACPWALRRSPEQPESRVLSSLRAEARMSARCALCGASRCMRESFDNRERNYYLVVLVERLCYIALRFSPFYCRVTPPEPLNKLQDSMTYLSLFSSAVKAKSTMSVGCRAPVVCRGEMEGGEASVSA